jgi:hypothetical protein
VAAGLNEAAGDSIRVRLPGGFVDDRGRRHAEVVLAPLTGTAERSLGEGGHDGAAASLTTAVLSRTVRRIGSLSRVGLEVLRALLIQDRDHLVARLGAMMLGDRLWTRLRCPACGEDMELPVDLDRLPVTERPLEARYFPFDEELEFRLPTGADQEWAAASPLAGDGLLAGLLGRCVRTRRGRRRPSALSAGQMAGLEARMRELAPDVTPELEVDCVHCQSAFTAEIDVPFLVLGHLVRASDRLDEDVHILAWNYHWAEQDILAMSRRRRDRYVRLVRDQVDAQVAT